MKQTVLVIGASKGIGLATVKAALANGYNIRAFARSAADIRIGHANLEKRTGDALNATDVVEALQGIDVVIQTLGVAVGMKMLTGPIDLFSRATRILVERMEGSEVKRLITVTGYGAGDGRRRISPLQRIGFEMFLARAYSDKDMQEEIIRRSSLDWTIVRPGVLTSAAATGDYQVLVEPENWRNGFVSRADIADFLVQQIEDESLVRKTPVLIGRCALPNI